MDDKNNDEDEISIDLSKIKNFFKRKKEEHKVEVAEPTANKEKKEPEKDKSLEEIKEEKKDDEPGKTANGEHAHEFRGECNTHEDGDDARRLRDGNP